MATRIQLRRGTAADWLTIDPILAAGEPGVETDTSRQKLGDGVKKWSQLPYASLSSAGIATDLANPASTVGAAARAASVAAVLDAPEVQAAAVTAGRAVFDPRRTNTAVVFGDSYAAMSRAVTGTVGTYGSIVYNPANGWFTWANAFLGQRLDVLKWAGITGQTTAQMLARVQADVISVNPGWVFLSSPGVNDMGSGVPLATTKANLSAIFTACETIGARVVVLSMPPRSVPSLSTAERAFLFGLNHWLREQSLKRPGLIYVDIFHALADPATGGDWLNKNASNPLQVTADGIHPAVQGAARIGRLVARALDNIVPRTDLLSFGINDPLNYAPNAGLAGTGGSLANGITGAVPTGWQVKSISGAAVEGTVASSIVSAVSVDATDYAGAPWHQIAATGGVPSSVQIYGEVSGATPLSVGDVMQGQAEVQFDADVSSVTSVQFRCGFFNGSFQNVLGQDLNLSGSETWPSEQGRLTLRLRTPPITVLSGATGFYLSLVVKAQGTYRMRRPEIRRNPAWV